MHQKITIRFLIFLFLMMPIIGLSQFTYIDVSVGNRFMTIAETKDMNTRSRYNQTNIQVNGLWRFMRNFGVGVSASIPVRQGGKYYINTVDASFFHAGFFNSVSDFDYHFEESAKVAFNGRLYGGTKGNFYVDARMSIFTFREVLKIDISSYEYVFPVKVSERNEFRQFAPGFSVGMNPHLSKNIFMNLNVGFDFYRFENVGFKKAGISETYTIQSYHSVNFKSQLPDKRYAFSANIGLGYFF